MSLCLIMLPMYVWKKYFSDKDIFFTYPDKPVRGGKDAGQAGGSFYAKSYHPLL